MRRIPLGELVRETSARIQRAVPEILAAYSFLTILPVPPRAVPSERILVRSRRWYPLVGMVLGILVAFADLVFTRLAHSTRSLASFWTVLVWIALTGMLHLDGLADCFDGLLAAGDAARRLAILRDPHVGSFGVVAIVLVILGKVLGLAALAGPTRAWGIVLALTAGRSAMLTVAGAGPYARLSGKGRFFIDATTPREGTAAAAVPLLLGALLLGGRGFAAALAGVLVSYLWALFCRMRIGGLTGDCLGAACELVEWVTLSVLAW